MTYSTTVIAAARRVSDVFASGCDRCDMADLDLLESEGLMDQRLVEHPSDTLEIGDYAWFFNDQGDQLLKAIRGEVERDAEQRPDPIAQAREDALREAADSVRELQRELGDHNEYFWWNYALKNADLAILALIDTGEEPGDG